LPKSIHHREIRPYLIPPSAIWLRTRSLKSLQKAVHHQRRRRAHVVAEFKLPEILGEMFFGDVNVGAFNGAFDLRPEAFNRVGVVDSMNVLLPGMVDLPVNVSKFRKRLVGAPFIGANGRTLLDVFLNEWQEGPLSNPAYHLGHNVTPTTNHSEDDSLLGTSGTFIRVPFPSANVSLVNLNVPVELVVPVHGSHVLSDLMGHSPSGLVGDGQLSLEFLGRDAMPGRGEQVESIEPLLQGGMAVLERGTRHWVDMVAAKLAGIGREWKAPSLETS
jgi:hypothetical protein